MGTFPPPLGGLAGFAGPLAWKAIKQAETPETPLSNALES